MLNCETWAGKRKKKKKKFKNSKYSRASDLVVEGVDLCVVVIVGRVVACDVTRHVHRALDVLHVVHGTLEAVGVVVRHPG
jgi:hypothetical protein